MTDETQWLHRLLTDLGETEIGLRTHTPPVTPTTPNNELRGADWTAWNLGVGADHADDILARFDTDVPAEATVIIIQAGHNDIYARRSVAQTEANLAAMCDKAKGRGARVILCTVPPYNTAGGATTAMKDDIETLNAWIRAKDDVLVADWYTALLTDPVNRESDYLDSDNIHLNAAGNDLVDETILPFLDYELDVAPIGAADVASGVSVAAGAGFVHLAASPSVALPETCGGRIPTTTSGAGLGVSLRARALLAPSGA